MRKIYSVIALLLLATLLVATTVDARRLEPMKVYVDMDDFVAQGDILEIYATVDNDESRDRLDDVQVRIMIPEIGLYGETGEFDVSARNVRSRTIGLDTYGMGPGTYDVFVFVSNDDFSRAKHRVITVY